MSPAESFAQELLQLDSIFPAQLVQLLDLLPVEMQAVSRFSAATAPDKNMQPHGFYAGASQGLNGSVSLKPSSVHFPLTVQVFTAFLRDVDPAHSFSSFVVLSNVRAPAHVDQLNDPASLSLVLALTPFQGGEIWLADPCGPVQQDTPQGPMQGRLHSLHKGPLRFKAHMCMHAVRPWEGRRVVLATYTVRSVHSIAPDDRLRLKALVPPFPPFPPLPAIPHQLPLPPFPS